MTIDPKAEPTPQEPAEELSPPAGPLEAPEETEDQQGPMAGFLASLPRLPSSQRKNPSPPPPSEPVGSPAAATTSSPAFTDLPEPPKTARPDWVDPADLQAAVRQACDVAFVMLGQGMGALEKRARRAEVVDQKWLPSKRERELVLAPAGRIAKRHIKADQTALDTIDGCMIAAGVGSFAMRGYFGLEPLGEDHDAK